jgi:hypothetical protein
MTNEKKQEISFTLIPTIEITEAEVDDIYIMIIYFQKKFVFSRVHSGVEVHLKLNNL